MGDKRTEVNSRATIIKKSSPFVLSLQDLFQIYYCRELALMLIRPQRRPGRFQSRKIYNIAALYCEPNYGENVRL